MTKVESLTDQQLLNIINRAPQNIVMWTTRQYDAWVEATQRGVIKIS